MNSLNREYLLHKIETARSAIAFASPGADIIFEKITLLMAEQKLAQIDAKTEGRGQ